MKERRSSATRLDELLEDLAEDALHLTDEELRAELDEDGTSLDAISARFRSAKAVAEARPRFAHAAMDAIPIASEPVEGSGPAPLAGVEGTESPYGEAKWRGRRVSRLKGKVGALLEMLPEFETVPFRVHAGMAAHPDLWCVARKPRNGMSGVAVGTVSKKYSLVQHREAVETCLRGLTRCGLRPDELDGEFTLSALGEWMDFSFVLPDQYSFEDTYGQKVEFRCGVSNSVDGSTRLNVRFSWFRQVCENGMVFAEHRRESRLHRSGLRLDTIEKHVFEEFQRARATRRTFSRWQRARPQEGELLRWADGALRRAWKGLAAARVLRICLDGHDVGYGSFGAGPPSQRAKRWEGDVTRRVPVPGSPARAETLYDVAQAMSWVASRRPNIVERVRWQSQIPELLDQLGVR